VVGTAPVDVIVRVDAEDVGANDVVMVRRRLVSGSRSSRSRGERSVEVRGGARASAIRRGERGIGLAIINALPAKHNLPDERVGRDGGGFSSAARCATPSSTTTAAPGMPRPRPRSATGNVAYRRRSPKPA